MRLVPIQRGGTVAEEVGVLPAIASEVMSATSQLYASAGFESPWICYLAMTNERIVGTCGFKGPPGEGRAEIAYFTFPGYEGKGVATQMARQLLQMARNADPGVVIAAQTLPARNASHRILEKLGFTCVGPLEHPDDGTVLEWRRPSKRSTSGQDL
jgi:[ribosomal protein S5]-alanine N-acetyltransferase